MAHMSAVDLVLAQQIPVDPKGSQPVYFRSKRTVQSSDKLQRHKNNVAAMLDGKDWDTQLIAKVAFSLASKISEGTDEGDAVKEVGSDFPMKKSDIEDVADKLTK